MAQYACMNKAFSVRGANSMALSHLAKQELHDDDPCQTPACELSGCTLILQPHETAHLGSGSHTIVGVCEDGQTTINNNNMEEVPWPRW